METTNTELDFNPLELLLYLKKKILLIGIVGVICAAAGFLVSVLFMTPQYTASTRVYVLNRTSSTSVVSSDFTLSNYMIADYQVLITGQNVTQEVVEKLDLNMSAARLSSKISVTAPSNTRFLNISVTDTNPETAAAIANCVREVASAQIRQIMDVDAVNLIYEAEVPTNPTSPNATKNTILAAIAGMAVTVLVFAIIFLLDDAIRTEDDVQRYLGLSTMGVIPASEDFGASTPRSQSTSRPQNTNRPVKK